jgi:hypothetical protein
MSAYGDVVEGFGVDGLATGSSCCGLICSGTWGRRRHRDFRYAQVTRPELIYRTAPGCWIQVLSRE